MECRKRASQGPVLPPDEPLVTKKVRRVDPTKEVCYPRCMCRVLSQLLTVYAQDWTERFSGLWQTQPKDFLLEKSFNQLVRDSGVCCICSLLAPTSPYTDFDPFQLKQLRSRSHGTPGRRQRRSQQCKSLTVVVQRSLVELPESLQHECSVASRESDDEEDSKLVTCQSCQICVHKCEFFLSPWLIV